MPPVTKAGGTAFRKDVEFVTKDADEQVAAGIVMVPDKADLQNDFVREGTIREFADQFGTFEEAGQAGGGIMHAVWPDGWMDLERNDVLDEPEEIGAETVDAGAWVQEWSIENDDLWGLIDEGILEGYSIGAIQVDWNGPFEQDEADDVDTSEVPDDEMVWELTDGLIREVSAVDIPAVPDAEILEAKAHDKRLADHVGNQDAFIEEAMERGHSEAEAQRLWDVLNAAIEEDGAAEPGKQSMLARAGKAFLDVLTGSDDGHQATAPEAPDETTAEGDHGEDDEDEEEEGAPTTDPDAGVDTPDGDGGQEAADDMTDNETDPDDPWADAPEWARDLRDDVQENSEQIDEALGSDEGSKDADADDAWEDAPEWAKALKADVDENAERIDTIVQQSGTSQQVDAAAEGGDEDDDGGLDAIGKALS